MLHFFRSAANWIVVVLLMFTGTPTSSSESFFPDCLELRHLILLPTLLLAQVEEFNLYNIRIKIFDSATIKNPDCSGINFSIKLKGFYHLMQLDQFRLFQHFGILRNKCIMDCQIHFVSEIGAPFSRVPVKRSSVSMDTSLE